LVSCPEENGKHPFKCSGTQGGLPPPRGEGFSLREKGGWFFFWGILRCWETQGFHRKKMPPAKKKKICRGCQNPPFKGHTLTKSLRGKTFHGKPIDWVRNVPLELWETKKEFGGGDGREEKTRRMKGGKGHHYPFWVKGEKKSFFFLGFPYS